MTPFSVLFALDIVIHLKERAREREFFTLLDMKARNVSCGFSMVELLST